MDKPKTHLIKSKSSNSAITTKSERKHNKKSRSNGEFLPEYQPLSLKKRGVYVEKKPTKISIKEQPDLSPEVISKKPSSPRPIPRPGRKRFLASVLTILSQSTTGTQYPDTDDTERIKKMEKVKIKLKKKKEDAIQEDATTAASTSSKKKQKYRSKVLNDHNSEFERLVVLKSTKEITHTPSNNSDKSNNLKEPETIKWADILPPLVNNGNLERINLPEDNRKSQEKKEARVSVIENDPSTMVADVPRKDEKKLYNFFVDLLETTFSVYNVKTEFNQPPVSSVNSSKVALEIDESVAKKLNIQKITEPECSDVKLIPKPSKHAYYIKPDDNEIWASKPSFEHTTKMSSKRSRPVSPTKSFKKKRRLGFETLAHKKAKPISTTNSLTIPNRNNLLKKDRKKNFINMLKEQLKMEDDAFEEPQNFFQALKVIARNKRRFQKSIHFNESAKKASEGDVHECQFKRRRILSASTKSSGKKSSYHPESVFMRSLRSYHNSDITASSKKKTLTITETSENELDPSQHSLEVYGFDYETNTHKKFRSDRDVMLAYNSSASMYDREYNMNEALLRFSDSGTSCFMESPSHITGHGLRSISRLLEQ